MTRIAKDLEEKICKEYQEHRITQKDLALKYSINRLSVQHILDRNKIPKMVHGEYEAKKKVDENFFSTLTDNSVYWLGFIYGDGNIDKNNLRIMLSEKDLNHLIAFKSDICSNHLIKIGTKTSDLNANGFVKYCKIAISRKRVTDSLRKLGLTENKTKRQRLPELDDKYMGPF